MSQHYAAMVDGDLEGVRREVAEAERALVAAEQTLVIAGQEFGAAAAFEAEMEKEVADASAAWLGQEQGSTAARHTAAMVETENRAHLGQLRAAIDASAGDTEEETCVAELEARLESLKQQLPSVRTALQDAEDQAANAARKHSEANIAYTKASAAHQTQLALCEATLERAMSLSAATSYGLG